MNSKFQLLGDWLEDSGWTNALVQADIANSGTVDSIVRASHVTKTRHAHQVTAVHTPPAGLRWRLYTRWDQTASWLSAFWWVVYTESRCQCSVWLLAEDPVFGVFLLRYIRSLREGNFQLYVESLTQLMPWMFALDHTHYALWLSIHIRDMTTLADKHPDVLAEF